MWRRFKSLFIWTRVFLGQIFLIQHEDDFAYYQIDALIRGKRRILYLRGEQAWPTSPSDSRYHVYIIETSFLGLFFRRYHGRPAIVRGKDPYLKLFVSRKPFEVFCANENRKLPGLSKNEKE